MSEIVIGYDGSDSSKTALGQALGFAQALGDSIVVVFGAAPGGYGGGEVPEQRKAVEEFGRKVTQEAVETAKAAKVDCTVEMHQRARSRGADHGRRQARRADDRRREPR